MNWTSNNGFNSNLEDIIDLYPGTYQLNVTDSNLCAYNEIFEIIQPSSLWISIDSIKNTLCNNSCEGLINITANGGDSSYTYSWTGPNGFISNNDDINFLCAGQYIVTIDDNISVLVDTFNIYEPQPIITNLNIDSIFML